ncbi:hypothetical protein Tco_1217526 [Tanacetum coccineum]
MMVKTMEVAWVRNDARDSYCCFFVGCFERCLLFLLCVFIGCSMMTRRWKSHRCGMMQGDVIVVWVVLKMLLCVFIGCSMMVKTMEVAWVWNDAGMLIVAVGVLKMLLCVFIGCSMMVKTMEVAWVWNDAWMLIVAVGVSRQWKSHGYFEDAVVGVYRHHLLTSFSQLFRITTLLFSVNLCYDIAQDALECVSLEFCSLV